MTENCRMIGPIQALFGLGPFCLQYQLPKNISRREKQTTKAVIGEKRVHLLVVDWIVAIIHGKQHKLSIL